VDRCQREVAKASIETELLPEAVRVWVAEAVDVPHFYRYPRSHCPGSCAEGLPGGGPLVNSIGGELKILAEKLPNYCLI
jgi:hypothetical protein